MTRWGKGQGSKGKGVDCIIRRGFLTLALLPLSLSLSLAASGDIAAPFLNIPVGAGPAALGSAYSTLAVDAYAPVWNPAGLAFVNGPSVTGQHQSYLESIHYEQAGGALRLTPRDGLGASIQYLGSGDIAGRDPDGNLTGDFSSYYAAYALAYGNRIQDRLGVGVCAKWIQAHLDNVGGHAFAADLGALYQVNEEWRVAAVLANAGTDLRFLNQSDPLPMAFRLAASYHRARWMASLEPVWQRGDGIDTRAGLEWSPIPLLALRTGYRTDLYKELSAMAGFSTGIGIRFWGSEFAYAWLPYGDLGNAHTFSLHVKFGDARDEGKNLVHVPGHRATRSAKAAQAGPDEEQLQLMQILVDTEAPKTAQPPSPR